MVRRTVYLVIAGLMALNLSGCMAAENKNLKKIEETEGLTKDYGELKQKYDMLVIDNSALKIESTDQAKSTMSLKADKVELEQILKAKPDTFSRNISVLLQKVAELEAENATLKADIATLRTAREEKVRELSGTYESLLQNMKNEISQGQVTISELKGKLTINMDAAILFDSGRVEIKANGLAILLKMVTTLKGVKDKAIRIEGHTDNATISGDLTKAFPTNWEFSAARAINVARYLQQQGLDPALLSAAACSEYRPVADNATKEGRAKNRRIEITLVAKD